MQQRKSKKIFIYFFFLIIVSSINNLNINSLKFDIVEDVNISGLSNTHKETLIEEIKNLDLESIFFLNGNEINKIIDKNTFIQEYEVFKKYPSSIHIKIQKTEFLAKINKNEKTYLVGSNGKLSNSNLSDKNLPYIFGNPNISQFLNLKNIINKSKFSYNNVENFFFYKSKRWDLELKDDVILKLPEANIKTSLDIAYEFLKDKKFDKSKIIDLRIKNQIIVND
tara:strand:+ start:185 stop:856 length:672 start_codon:yes stop_codon:yes gene_type:complete